MYADIASTYGINPFDLSHEQLLMLHFCIPTITAKQEVTTRSARSELTPDRLFELVYTITGDADLADRKRAWRQINQLKQKTSLESKRGSIIPRFLPIR